MSSCVRRCSPQGGDGLYREHPINILKYAGKNIWLLVFPLLRGIRSIRLDVYAFYHWLQGAWFDLLVVLVILGIGYLRWHFIQFRAERNCFVYSSGILIRREVVIPYDNLSVITAEHPWWLRPLFAVRVQLDTRAGALKTMDISILVRRSDYRRIKQRLPIRLRSSKTRIYRPHWLSIVFFSFIFSSSLSGALYLSTFFLQFGKMVDTMLQESLTRRLTEMAGEMAEEITAHMAQISRIASKIPPIAVGAAIVLLSAWLLSFLVNMLRYIGFRYEQDEHQLRIRSGLLTRRRYIIQSDRINYIDLRQNLFMKVCRMTSVQLNCSGYGNARRELPVMVPMIPRQKIQEAVSSFYPQAFPKKNQFRAPNNGMMTYLYAPGIAAAVIPIVSRLLQNLLPQFSDFISFGMLMLEIPMLWMLVVKTVAWRTTGITVQGNLLCVRYCRGFRFHTLLADQGALAKIQIRVSPFQRWYRKCDLHLYFYGSIPHGHPLLGFRIQDVEQLYAQLGLSLPDELPECGIHRQTENTAPEA